MIENTILANLLKNDEYFRKVFPYIKTEYFEDYSIKKIFETLVDFVADYKCLPSQEALLIMLDKRRDFNEDQFKQAKAIISELSVDENTNQEWLESETEKFCQDRAIFLAVRRGILILDGEDKELDKGAIPKLLQDALAVSFDTEIGHDYLEDFDKRFDFYHRVEERLPFDLDLLNDITDGGLPNKSLSVILGACVHPDTNIRIRLRKRTQQRVRPPIDQPSSM